MGRPPSKYTPEIVQRIVHEIENGSKFLAAASLVDISSKTAASWLKTKPEFAEAVARAEATFMKTCFQNITESRNSKGEHDWRASAWLLEHRFREEFGGASSKPPAAKPEQAPRCAISEAERQKIIVRRKAALAATD